MEQRKKIDLIISVLVLALGILVFVLSRQFPPMPEGHPGPGLFPGVISIGLVIAGLSLLVNALKGPVGETIFTTGHWKSVLVILSIIVVLPFLQSSLGFLVSIAIATFIVGLLMRISFLKAIIVAVLTSAFIYLIFVQILHVPL